ncbi:ABC transporter ATP-binding protein [Raineyella fluvialis]|uniref:ATP-binding cassette domain-containing protein n=1 Tax=Raineyella fluvialis TaxID=2662261 RepID=A0A5Q2FDX1_9ACTN|nr:ABC transporter ATP-binding protein [Raineyella fluvialis]QGF24968.1 ATP-binding cassette domain-containing protein [Raineyella fluvialis]
MLDSPDALEIDDLVVRLGGRTIIDSLSLRAEPGRVTALLGPNGAGKTTLIRCCTGILTPDAGAIRIMGDDAAAACQQGRVGMMPQTTGAWSGVRPLELLRYLASLHAHPLPIEPLAERLGLHEFASTPYRRLSGGQQQAVNLAGALVGRPELVFLDEPTAGMDPHSRRSVWSLVHDLRAAGVSVLLTTHLMDEAAELADRIWIIDHGRIALSGTVEELTADGRSLEDVFLANTDSRMRP